MASRVAALISWRVVVMIVGVGGCSLGGAGGIVVGRLVVEVVVGLVGVLEASDSSKSCSTIFDGNLDGSVEESLLSSTPLVSGIGCC